MQHKVLKFSMFFENIFKCQNISYLIKEEDQIVKTDGSVNMLYVSKVNIYLLLPA
jgi:hypothetical protein